MTFTSQIKSVTYTKKLGSDGGPFLLSSTTPYSDFYPSVFHKQCTPGSPGKYFIWFYMCNSSQSVCSCWVPVLLVTERGVLKTPAVIVDVFASSFNSISFCFYYFEAVLLSTYIFRIIMPSWRMDSCHYVTSLFIPSKFSCFEAYFIWY